MPNPTLNIMIKNKVLNIMMIYFPNNMEHYDEIANTAVLQLA